MLFVQVVNARYHSLAAMSQDGDACTPLASSMLYVILYYMHTESRVRKFARPNSL
jgi:hypothetical protein